MKKRLIPKHLQGYVIYKLKALGRFPGYYYYVSPNGERKKILRDDYRRTVLRVRLNQMDAYNKKYSGIFGSILGALFGTPPSYEISDSDVIRDYEKWLNTPEGREGEKDRMRIFNSVF